MNVSNTVEMKPARQAYAQAQAEQVYTLSSSCSLVSRRYGTEHTVTILSAHGQFFCMLVFWASSLYACAYVIKKTRLKLVGGD